MFEKVSLSLKYDSNFFGPQTCIWTPTPITLPPWGLVLHNKVPFPKSAHTRIYIYTYCYILRSNNLWIGREQASGHLNIMPWVFNCTCGGWRLWFCIFQDEEQNLEKLIYM